MADAALSALVTDVLGRLTSTAIQELGRLWRLEDEVSALKETYTQIRFILSDAEKKQKGRDDIETWLKSLRSASLEVEDILDLVSTEAMLQKLYKRDVTHKVRVFFRSDRNPLMVRARIANKVKIIRRRLDRIAANRIKFNLTSDTTSTMDVGGGSETTINRETTSLLHMSSMIYGRDEEVEEVTDKICSEEIVRHDTEGVRVYVIWGIGGVGKTTLAQLVYNHERVKTHFDLQSWVYVSSEFEVKKLTQEVIESIDKDQCQIPRLDDMQVDLQKKLKGKRFLIVLDDVWIEESTKWDELSKALSSGAEGSIVLVTTRNQTTCNMMAKVAGFRHEVGCLSKESSWSLFKKLAFASEREGENIKELEAIGKEIVDRCKGLPLAVKTLGGLMQSKGRVNQWRTVNDSEVWELQEDDILSSLKLSYDDLPPDLKRCFTYCGLFPKGYKMEKDILIELWMANGFIPRRGDVDLYVIAEEVFNCLLSRSFFQGVQSKYSFDPLVCKMHDLMHDLARYVTGHDCSIIKQGNKLTNPDELLHVGLWSSDIPFLDENLKMLRSLRSIIILNGGNYSEKINQFSRHMCIRVLHLNGIEELPRSICELKHLRYLRISNSKMRFLPESIIYLQNLEALHVPKCYSLCKLPKGIRYMKNLRCLDNQGCLDLEYMSGVIKELTNLQRLPRFHVGKEKGAARIGELGCLNLLGRDLELSGIDNVEGLEDARSANLKGKKNLMSLDLCWYGDETDERLCRKNEEVLEGLEPNPNLLELRIRGYKGKTMSPNWMMNLRNLVNIKFKTCSRCESIPSLGKLPCLKVITVFNMRALIRFDDDELPSLQELEIYRCPLLTSLPSNFPKLRELCIEDCELLQSLPTGSLKELTSLTIWGNETLREKCKKGSGEEWPKISHVPHIRLYRYT